MNEQNLMNIGKRPDHKELSSKGGKNKRGSKTIKTQLKELLALRDKKDGEYSVPIALKMIERGIDGDDSRMLVEIADRVEGKTTVPIEQKISGSLNTISLDVSDKTPEELIRILVDANSK